jgi:hypothetical protein
VAFPISWRRDDLDPAPAAPQGRLGGAAGPLAGFAIGLAVAAVGVLAAVPIARGAVEAQPRAIAAAEPDMPRLDARLEGLEAALRATAERAAQAEAVARRAEAAAALQGPQADRFLAAALLLQASAATARPWLREFQAMAALAPAEALPRPLHEVLASHAARGLPTEAELRERFLALAPQLLARAPSDAGLLSRAASTLRGGFAVVGLASAPRPGAQEAAIAGILDQLRRGNLVAATADAAALDDAVQPLLAGWLAQARARLAVEQAVQETLLRALSASPRPA